VPVDRRRARRPPPRSEPVDAASPPRGSARTAALTLLGRRDYTAAELEDKLTARGYAPDDIATTLEALTAAKIVDDRRVAAAFVRTALKVKGRGRYRIERELLARGVDRALVAGLLSELVPDDETASIARILARKRLSPHPTLAERRRLYQHLLRRGFSTDAISKALKARGSEIEE
jgi:regulatory protein